MPARAPIKTFLAYVGALAVLMMLSAVISTCLLTGGERFKSGNVGHLKVEGLITAELARQAVQDLIRFRENKDVKAILLRVDSPGGPITPAQEIYVEVKKTVATKPVVVSMGSLAASGGYYISAPASKIVANPATVTGSIGVIMEHFVLDSIARKFLLKWEIIKAGEVKDMGSLLREFTPKERALMKNLAVIMHNQFIRDVADGRQMPIAAVRKLATGEVFSGEQALELKLVDELGSEQHALEIAGKLANLKDKPKLVESTHERGWRARLLEHLLGSSQGLLQSLHSAWLPQARVQHPTLLPQ